MFRPFGAIFRSSLGTYFYITFFAVLFYICIRDPLCIRSELRRMEHNFSAVST